MIDERSVTDPEGLRLLKEALRDLIVRVPLAGLTLLGASLTIREQRGCVTLATDGRVIYYDPEWMKAKDLKNRVIDVLHEWLHCFDNHVARCGDRKRKLWNTAVDIIVLQQALELLGPGFSVPHDGVQIPPWAKGKTAEEVYDLLPTHSTQVGTLPGLPSADDLRWTAQTPQAESAFLDGFRQDLAQAAVALGGDQSKLPDFLRTRLTEIMNDSSDWGRILAGSLVADLEGTIPVYSPPNRRFLGQSYTNGAPIILPTYRSDKVLVLLLAIDVSASVGETLLSKFGASVVPAALRATKTIVVTFDQKIRERHTCRNPRELLTKLTFLSGAHHYTSAMGVFEIADEIKASSICVLTDGYIQYPQAPYANTHWVVPIGGGHPSWGRIHTMQVSW